MKKQMKSVTDAVGCRKVKNKKTVVQLHPVTLRMQDADAAWAKVVVGELPTLPYWAPGTFPVREKPAGYFYPSNTGIVFCEAWNTDDGTLVVPDCNPEQIQKILKKDEDQYKESFGCAVVGAVNRLLGVYIVENQRKALTQMKRDVSLRVHIDDYTSKVMQEYFDAVKAWAKYRTKDIRKLLTDGQYGKKFKKTKKNCQKKKK